MLEAIAREVFDHGEGEEAQLHAQGKLRERRRRLPSKVRGKAPKAPAKASGKRKVRAGEDEAAAEDSGSDSDEEGGSLRGKGKAGRAVGRFTKYRTAINLPLMVPAR